VPIIKGDGKGAMKCVRRVRLWMEEEEEKRRERSSDHD
jgi:hypothetical protein